VPWSAHLQCLLSELGIKPDWTVVGSDGVGFVAADLGTWLSVSESPDGSAWLTAQTRVALDVPDTSRNWRVIDERNGRSAIGRWVLDDGVVALTASVPASAPLALLAAVVSDIVSAAETAAFLGWAQRDLGGRKALTLVNGAGRNSAHPVASYRHEVVVPAGQSSAAALEVVTWAMDELLFVLPDHDVEPEDDGQGCLAISDAGMWLRLRAAQHPSLGWGVMIALSGERWAGQEADVLRRALNANRTEPARAHRWAAGTWLFNGAGLEHRIFLPSALLDPLPGIEAVTVVQELVAEVAGREEAPAAARPASPALRRGWPHDDRAAVQARREPINDGVECDAPDLSIYLDRLGRACGITDASFHAWERRLTAEDHEHDRVASFRQFAEARIADRARRAS
jgi:hypothetical protein